MITSFDLRRAADLPKLLLLLPYVLNHGLMSVLLLFLFTVLLFFFFQPIHVPRLSTLRDSLGWDLSADHFDLGHWLDIYLLIHVGLVVEHVLRSGHRLRLLNCYFRGLLLAHRLLLKGWR